MNTTNARAEKKRKPKSDAVANRVSGSEESIPSILEKNEGKPVGFSVVKQKNINSSGGSIPPTSDNLKKHFDWFSYFLTEYYSDDRMPVDVYDKLRDAWELLEKGRGSGWSGDYD